MKDLKCSSGRLLGTVEGHFLEIACRSTKCGKRPGVVVIHKFDTRTGECLSTRLYQEAHDTTHLKGEERGITNEGSSLRSA